MNFAQENLRPIGCNLSEQAHAIAIDLEPFEIVLDGESSEQDEPALEFNGFQLPTSNLSQLAGKTFDIQSAPQRCEGSIYLSINSMGEHFWVDLLKLEFGELVGDGLNARIHVRFTDLYFSDPASFEHAFETVVQVLSDD